MSELKFFSEEWCKEATKAEQALSDEILKVFKNPATFNHVMGFEVADRPGAAIQGKYLEAHIQGWSPENLLPEDQLWALFKGKLEHFQEAVKGETPALKLVMSGKIRLAKGSMRDAMDNAKAMDVLLTTWGTVPTDWNI